MEKIVHKTTREHYEKYKALAEKLGVQFTQKSIEFFNYPSIKVLRGHYAVDPALNGQVGHAGGLSSFDGWFYKLQCYQPEARVLSVSEGVCIGKHCLIYQVLKATPEFID
jgi:hypothetical protein